MKVAQPSIERSARAGHGRTLNVHRESKGENIGQNYAWLHGNRKPTPVQVPSPAPKPPAQPKKPPAQPKQNPPKNNGSDNTGTGVASGKAANAVDGKDLAGKFKFDNNSTDYSIEQVIKAQGFDGKPTVTTDYADFQSACKASNFLAKRGISASNQQTLDAYDNELKNGNFYVKCSGGSVHGYGMYAASVQINDGTTSTLKRGIQSADSTANAYAGYSRHSKVYSMTLDKSAKIGNERDIANQMHSDKEYAKVCKDSTMNRRYTMDVGVYAAYKGYDAYVAGKGRSGRPPNSDSDYTVILNRSKLIIYDDSNVPF